MGRNCPRCGSEITFGEMKYHYRENHHPIKDYLAEDGEFPQTYFNPHNGKVTCQYCGNDYYSLKIHFGAEEGCYDNIETYLEHYPDAPIGAVNPVELGKESIKDETLYYDAGYMLLLKLEHKIENMKEH